MIGLTNARGMELIRRNRNLIELLYKGNKSKDKYAIILLYFILVSNI